MVNHQQVFASLVRVVVLLALALQVPVKVVQRTIIWMEQVV